MSTYESIEYSPILSNPSQIFRNVCESNEPKKIGVEFEILPVSGDTFLAADYFGQDGIEGALEDFSNALGWRPLYENGHIIALKDNDRALSLEPGGQLELSSKPYTNLLDIENEFRYFLSIIIPILQKRNIFALGMGLQPFSDIDSVKIVPKTRYKIMDNYLSKRGKLARYMMRLSAGIQCNFDYRSEEEAEKIYKTSLVVSPLITAITANSPLYQGNLTFYHSYRSLIWLDTDPDRCGVLSEWFNSRFTFESYIEYVMNIPVFFIVRNNEWIHPDRITFREFYAKGYGGYVATEADWNLHLTTIFNEIRFKPIFEVRGNDALPYKYSLSIPALWKGILYDISAQNAVQDLLVFKNKDALLKFHNDIIRDSLDAKLNNHKAIDLAKEILDIARNGLINQKSLDRTLPDEAKYLQPLEEILKNKSSPAKTFITKFRTGEKTLNELISESIFGVL